MPSLPTASTPSAGFKSFESTVANATSLLTKWGVLAKPFGLARPRGCRGRKTKSALDQSTSAKRRTAARCYRIHVTTAFRLLLFTGCRLREILHLRWSEIDFDRGLLLLPDSKTGKKAVVLNAPALQLLNDLDRIGEFVVLGDNLSKPRSDLARPWALIRHYAELQDVRIHDLRHTHASVGAGSGMGLPLIGKLLGHKHQATTMKYAHLDNDPLRRASNTIGITIAAALGDVPPTAQVKLLRDKAS